jgi:hypothetical protein
MNKLKVKALLTWDFISLSRRNLDGVDCGVCHCVGELSSTAGKYEESATCHGSRIIRGVSRRHGQLCCKTRGDSYQRYILRGF